jgi:hypothetical protein
MIWAFAGSVGAGSFAKQFGNGDPDLPPSAQSIDKEAYLAAREEWTLLRRGFDPKLPFDPDARNRAIEQMGRQLNDLEIARLNRGGDASEISGTAWTPVGPAPLPRGQTETRPDPVTGRVIAIAVHPSDPKIVFVGTASGGLYRTTNGTDPSPTWTPLMDTVQLQSNGASALGTLAVGAIAIAPSDPNVVYIGTGEQRTGYFGSGLYRLDNATTASPTLVGPINPTENYGNGMTPAFGLRAISKILVHPTAPGTIFVSTSSGQAGLTTHNGSNPPLSIPPLGILGIYRSTTGLNAAGAVTFTKLKVNEQPPATLGDTDISDMVLDPSDATANTLVAWVRSGGGVDASCVAGNNCAGIYRSTDAQTTGTFTQQLVALNGGTRGELSVNRVADTVTVLAATGESPTAVPGNPNPNNCNPTHLGLLRRSVDGGVTWPNTDSTAATQAGIVRAADGFCGSQCFYDIAVAIDPQNSNHIEIGGNANYGGCQTLTKRSADGVTFTGNSVGLHADVHAFTISPSNSAIVWNGSDGGLWRSTDSGLTWVSMNGDAGSSTNVAGKINAMQYVSIATHPRDREYMTGGTQDNGTHLKRAAANAGAWSQIAFGDGGYTAIDQNATDTTNVRVYHTYFNTAGAGAQITYEYVTTTADAEAKAWTNRGCVAGGAGNTRIDCNDTAVLFYAPMVVGPGSPNTLYFGTDRLYRSSDGGDTMQPVSGTGPIAGNGVAVSSISVGLGNDNVRLVGMRNGKVYATTSGGTLVDVTPAGAPAGVTVGKVMVDPNNTDPNAITAYIAYGGLGRATAPITHIWKTTNLAGGASTWVAMSNGLPDVPVNAIAIDRLSATAPAAGTTLYLGTDIGVYRSNDGGANWEIFNPGNTLPVVPVFDIAFQQEQAPDVRILRIATHGRGIWEIQTGGTPLPAVQFAAAATRVNENAGMANLTVTRTGDTSAPTAVNYSTGGGTATPGQDYTPTSGQLTFAPGETTKMISVPILADPNPEPDETFVASLTPATPGADGSLSEETVTIDDDDGGAPTAIAIVSRKVHGNAGAFDIPLPAIGNEGIESRSGGAANDYQIIFTFPTAVTFSNAAVSSGSGMVTGSGGSGTNAITVNLTGVANAQRLALTLADVSDGEGTGEVAVQMGVLVGDVNASGSVGSSDIGQTKAVSGQPVNASNFRADVNVSGGSINASDIGFVKARSGSTITP